MLPRGGRSRFAPTPPRVRCDYFRSRRGHNGFPRSSEADLLCQRRTSLRIGWRDDWVISRQLPAGAICRRFQPMSVAEMPAQHQAAKPAFEADDMLVLHRSPDRNRRRQGFGREHRRVRAETTERAMHRCDKTPDLIDTDTVLPDITTDDLRNQAGIDLLRGTFLGHIFCPNVVDWGLCSRAWFGCNFAVCKYFKQGSSPVVRTNNTFVSNPDR